MTPHRFIPGLLKTYYFALWKELAFLAHHLVHIVFDMGEPPFLEISLLTWALLNIFGGNTVAGD